MFLAYSLETFDIWAKIRRLATSSMKLMKRLTLEIEPIGSFSSFMTLAKLGICRGATPLEIGRFAETGGGSQLINLAIANLRKAIIVGQKKMRSSEGMVKQILRAGTRKI